MPAITVVDLTNAKTDVDHIAAIATSTSPTATDRLGQTKKTLAGSLAEFPNASANATTATTQAGIATAQAVIATSQAGIAAAAKVAAESARDSALIQAGVYTTEALGRAAVVDRQAFKVQGSGDIAAFEYLRVSAGVVSTLIATYPSKAAIDAVTDVINIQQGPSEYTIAEMDDYGRMSRYVDAAGKTWVLLHDDVQLPGEQVVNLREGALHADLRELLLPAGYKFQSLGGFPLCLVDSTGHLSELVIDETGRFPDWVARSIVARATQGGSTQPLGGMVLPEVYTDCTQLANNATVPIDTSQTSSSFGGAPMYVAGGKVIHGNVLPTNNGGYVEVELSKTVTRIGAAINFPAGSDNASIALVLPVTSWAATFGGASPAGVHFVLSGSGAWHCSCWEPGEDIYAAGIIANIADGVTRFVDIQINGNQVLIKLPDGSVSTVINAKVSPNISNLAIWELYESAAMSNRASFLAMWADSSVIAPALRDSRPMAQSINKFISQEA